jgi:hypothetical protein
MFEIKKYFIKYHLIPKSWFGLLTHTFGAVQTAMGGGDSPVQTSMGGGPYKVPWVGLFDFFFFYFILNL